MDENNKSKEIVNSEKELAKVKEPESAKLFLNIYMKMILYILKELKIGTIFWHHWN